MWLCGVRFGLGGGCPCLVLTIWGSSKFTCLLKEESCHRLSNQRYVCLKAEIIIIIYTFTLSSLLRGM